MGLSIDEFWNEELAFRKDLAYNLNLHSYDGNEYFFVRTEKFLKAADSILEIARNVSDAGIFTELFSEGMIEEARYSSAIEGAHSTGEGAAAVVKSGMAKDKDERMILNNYLALQFVNEHIDYPVNESVVV